MRRVLQSASPMTSVNNSEESKETQLGFSDTPSAFSAPCKPLTRCSIYMWKPQVPFYCSLSLKKALHAPALSPDLPFSSKNQDKLYQPVPWVTQHCSFLCFCSLVSSRESSPWSRERCPYPSQEVGTRWSLRPLSTQAILGFISCLVCVYFLTS